MTQFKVGDKVETNFHGKGVVVEILEDNTYPVLVKFESGCLTDFTLNGMYNIYVENVVNSNLRLIPEPVKETPMGEASTAIKHDEGKPDYSLVPLDLLDGVAQVFKHGEQKYNRHNFRKGFEPDRLIASTLRHLTELQSAIRTEDKNGEQGHLLDKESGHGHIHHAISSLLMLVHSLRLKGYKV